jgi:dolichyl-phosphate beta-glucosyltransferase
VSTSEIYLSIILPAYNEAGNIATAVATNIEAARTLSIPFEVLAINDGSADNTGELLSQLECQWPELRVVSHEKNSGLGAAIRTGLTNARGQFCIISPADSPLSPQTLKPFLAVADESDLILGYRVQKPGYSWIMIFNSRLYHAALRMVCGLPYRDVNWIHLYRRSIFERIELDFVGIVMEAEVVLKAHALGMRIREVPCPMTERVIGQASAAQPKVMYRTGRDLLRLLWDWKFGPLRAKLGKGMLTDHS